MWFILLFLGQVNAQVIPSADSVYNAGGREIAVGQYLFSDSLIVIPYHDNEVGLVIDPDVDMSELDPSIVPIDSASGIGGEPILILCTGQELASAYAGRIRSLPGVRSAYPLLGSGRRTTDNITILSNEVIIALEAGVDSVVATQVAADHHLIQLTRRPGATTYTAWISSADDNHVLQAVSRLNLDVRVNYAEPNLWYFLRDTGIGHRGDFDRNGSVDFADFLLFVKNFGQTYECRTSAARFDLDFSGTVDLGDFLLFAANFGKSN